MPFWFYGKAKSRCKIDCHLNCFLKVLPAGTNKKYIIHPYDAPMYHPVAPLVSEADSISVNIRDDILRSPLAEKGTNKKAFVSVNLVIIEQGIEKARQCLRYHNHV